MVMRARANVYHLECFACQQCGHRFCVGDHFYLHDNQVQILWIWDTLLKLWFCPIKIEWALWQVLCGPDYEERMVFASLSSHPNQLAQIRQTSHENSSHPVGQMVQLRRGSLSALNHPSSLPASAPFSSSSSSPSSLVQMPLPPIQTMWLIQRNTHHCHKYRPMQCNV